MEVMACVLTAFPRACGGDPFKIRQPNTYADFSPRMRDDFSYDRSNNGTVDTGSGNLASKFSVLSCYVQDRAGNGGNGCFI